MGNLVKILEGPKEPLDDLVVRYIIIFAVNHHGIISLYPSGDCDASQLFFFFSSSSLYWLNLTVWFSLPFHPPVKIVASYPSHYCVGGRLRQCTHLGDESRGKLERICAWFQGTGGEFRVWGAWRRIRCGRCLLFIRMRMVKATNYKMGRPSCSTVPSLPHPPSL